MAVSTLEKSLPNFMIHFTLNSLMKIKIHVFNVFIKLILPYMLLKFINNDFLSTFTFTK